MMLSTKGFRERWIDEEVYCMGVGGLKFVDECGKKRYVEMGWVSDAHKSEIKI